MLGGILRATEDGSVVQAVRIRVDGVQEIGIQHGRRRLHVVAQPGCMRSGSATAASIVLPALEDLSRGKGPPSCRRWSDGHVRPRRRPAEGGMLGGILRAMEDGSVVQEIGIRVGGVQENGIRVGGVRLGHNRPGGIQHGQRRR